MKNKSKSIWQAVTRTLKSGHDDPGDYDYWQCDDCDSTYAENPIACDYCGSFAVEGMYHQKYDK